MRAFAPTGSVTRRCSTRYCTIGASDLELQLSLAVFSQISEVTFGYVDWITQQVVSTYQSERDRWMENQNSMRTVRVRELLDGADVDIDAVTAAIRYPLRRTHLAIVVWRDDDDGGDDVAAIGRFVHQLADSAGAESSLFISVKAFTLTGWAWIALMADAAPDATARLRAFAASQTDALRLAVGDPILPTWVASGVARAGAKRPYGRDRVGLQSAPGYRRR